MGSTGQSPEDPQSFFMGSASSLTSVSGLSETILAPLFYPQPPADSIPQKSICDVETFSHQLLH